MNCIVDAQEQQNDEVGSKMLRRDLSRSFGNGRGRSTGHEPGCCEECNNCEICQIRKYYRDQLKIKLKFQNRLNNPARQLTNDIDLKVPAACRSIPNTRRPSQYKPLLRISPKFIRGIKNYKPKPQEQLQNHTPQTKCVDLHEIEMTGNFFRNSENGTRNIGNVKYSKVQDTDRQYSIHNERNSIDEEMDRIILKMRKSKKYENNSSAASSSNVNKKTRYPHIDANTNTFRSKHQHQDAPLPRSDQAPKALKHGRSEVGQYFHTIRTKRQPLSLPKEVQSIPVTKYLQQNMEIAYQRGNTDNILNKKIHKDQQSCEVMERVELKPKKHYNLLERKVQLTRSKINQGIKHTKQDCIMKSLCNEPIKCLELNQKKFWMERYREDLNHNSSVSDNKPKLKQKASSLIHFEQLELVEGNSMDTNKILFTEEYEEQKLEQNKSIANEINNEKKHCDNKLQSSSPMQNGITQFSSSKKYIKPQNLPTSGKRVAKKDVATYIAPMEHVKETLRGLRDNLCTTKHTKIAQSNLNELEHIFKNKGNHGHIKGQCSEKYEQDFNTKRIEKYKKEYSQMNKSIRENVKLINKYTTAPMSSTGKKKKECENGVKQSTKPIDLVTPIELRFQNIKEHLENTSTIESNEIIDTNKNETNENIKNCRKSFKDKPITLENDNTNECIGTVLKVFTKSKLKKSEKDLPNVKTNNNYNIINACESNSNITEECNIKQVQYLYQSLNLKQTKLLKSLERCQNKRDCHIDNRSLGDHKTSCNIRNSSNEHELKDFGNGDVKKVNMPNDSTHIKTKQVKHNALGNHKNSIKNLTKENTAKYSKTKEGATEKNSTIVDKLKAMFASVKSDMKKQSSLLLNSKPNSTESTQSNNCIKLMSMRKLKNLIVKESESDGELYRRRQMKQLRRQQLLLKNLKDREVFQNKAKTLGEPNRTKYFNNTKADLKQYNKETKTEILYPKTEDDDKFLKCTEYFIQHMKTSRPNFTQLTHSSVMRQLMSRGTTLNTKEEIIINSGTYKQHLGKRKSDTRKIMNTIDEKIHQLNLTLKEKFLQDKRNMVEGSSNEMKHCHEDGVVNADTFVEPTVPREADEKTPGSSKETNDQPLTTGTVLKTTRSFVDLNLDLVFANKNNWVILDMNDEMRIRSDIGQLLNQ